MLRDKDMASVIITCNTNPDLDGFEFVGQRIGIAQIEMMGGRDLLEQRRDEIFIELAELKA